MSNKIKIAVRAVLAGTALSVASSGAYAINAVTPNIHKWDGQDNVVGANETITASNLTFGPVHGAITNTWTDNPTMPNSAWGHAVEWNTFQVTAANQVVTIKDQVTAGLSSRAFTVWASNDEFDGGILQSSEIALNTAPYTWTAPHSFNAVGQIGSPGTLWMADPSVAIIDPTFSPGAVQGSNMLRTLAYVNAGKGHAGDLTNWNETINAGVNRVDASNDYFSSVTGDYSASMAELVFTNLAPGWYAVASGAADSSINSSKIKHALSVTTTSAVPLPGAVYLFGTALAGLVASARRKQILA
ncbi:MAG: VPLPA-CTERM sorting domain-containing protein [Methylococcaceae bacterium]|nr:VPLPA-CTERM sorting domain-containing protein [Methylococcaceae bacterium]